jgi:Fe-S cluster biogenesis protein NfuA
MTKGVDAREFQAELQRLDGMLQDVEHTGDPASRERTRRIVRAVLTLHGAGLERLLSHLEAAGAAGQPVLDACAGDDVVSGLLLLHGLHPLDVVARVRHALDDVRPFLRAHGGNVMLLGIADGIVRLRLEGSCHSCPSSTVTMKQTIEAAIFGKAPDVTAVEVESSSDNAPASADGLWRVALPLV